MEFEDRAKPNSVQFVLLHHTLPDDCMRKSHWDLMIEAGDFLLTFELQSLPGNLLGSARVDWPVTRLADHRRHYLNYEGVIAPSAQADSQNASSASPEPAGNRGSVRRIAAGTAMCRIAQPEGLVHCQLRSAELSADFYYTACRVGEVTQLRIDSWHWTQHARPEN